MFGADYMKQTHRVITGGEATNTELQPLKPRNEDIDIEGGMYFSH